MRKKIDLDKLMAEGHCSMEIAKRLAKAGVAATWPNLTYNKEGRLSDGGWVKKIQGERSEFFPAVNLYEAYMLVGEVADAAPEFFYDGQQYVLQIGKRQTTGASKVDALCNMYLEYKEK
ncbi:MAG: hypothetical protein KDD04_02600 [Sinomicrobium sp.]|nr:hypothetical protein [Sinomicrobium sp.]